MSVIKSKRGESAVEFLHTARELRIFTIQKCVRFPARYGPYVAEPMVKTAVSIHENVERANRIYPSTREQADLRLDYLTVAKWSVESLVSQISVAGELLDLSEETMQHWMELVDRETRLIAGIIKKDRERYKKLP